MNPITLGRVSNLMRGNLVTSTVTRTQAMLAEVQQQLTTGKRLASPSDDTGDAAIAQSIRKLLETRESYKTNLGAANNGLSEVDTQLSSATDLLREAQQVASANVGSDVTAEARTAAADVVDSIYNQMLSIGNKSSAGVYLFAGDRSTNAPFEEAGGGVKWVGSSDLLSNVMDEGTQSTFQVDGAQVFGALSARVQGHADLTPALAAGTRLDDLNGAQERGVRRGLIAISDGTTSANVDLRDADTLGDVIQRINDSGVGGVTAALNAAGDGIDLASTGAISVKDVGGGSAAADLGILQTNAAAGVSGGSVGPRLTGLTPVAALKGGAGIDLAGLTITNGATTKRIDLTAARTVEDVLNTINGSSANVNARINAGGTGIDILNAVQGTTLKIAENGGTTGDDLGVRSFDGATKLADLNDGAGLTNVVGTELKITDAGGVSFEVDFDGLATVDDLLNRINANATAAGARVSASVGGGSNGIVLIDSSGGAGTLVATNVNSSRAVAELGLDAAPVAGNALIGSDVAPVSSQGVFANLIRLRNALRASDQTQITKASTGLDDDLDRVVRVRGQVGAKVQEFESRTTSLADGNVATQSLLSELEDTDFTSAIVKFQTLQTSLQASMQAAGKTLNMSLMDFLS